MFFEKDSINDKLQCPMCKQRFQDPVLLPCEEFVCEKCIRDYIEDNSEKGDDQFHCYLCKQDHSIPPNGFIKSKRMRLLLEVEPKNFRRGKAIEQFQADLDKCFDEIRDIRETLVNKEKILRDHFELQRYHILTVTESKIDEINKRSIEFLDQIDQLEKENLEYLKDDSQEKEIQSDLKQAEEICTDWINRIKLPETREDFVEKERPSLNSILRLIQKSNWNKNLYIFNWRQADFVENLANVDSSFIGKIEKEICIREKDSLRNVSLMSQQLNLNDHLLLGLNEFKNDNMLAVYAFNFYYNKRRDSEKCEFEIYFSILGSAGNITKSLSISLSFSSLQFDENYFYKSANSFTNGSHVLISFCFAGYNFQLLCIISNETQNKFELRFNPPKECKTSINSKNAYIMNEKERELGIFDFELKKIKSIKIKEELNFLFGSSLIMINEEDLLYAALADKIVIYQLPNLEPINSFEIKQNCSPMSSHFINGYFVSRFEDHFQYLDLKYAKAFQRAVNDLNLSDSNIQMRALDQERFIFFNNKTKQIHIFS